MHISHVSRRELKSRMSTKTTKKHSENDVPLYLFHEGSNSNAYEYFGSHRKIRIPWFSEFGRLTQKMSALREILTIGRRLKIR